MEAYYRTRAAEYENIYGQAKWQDDLAWLRRWVTGLVRGRTVLDIAAGTGYWTEIAASTAAAITACDAVPETLARAAARQMGPHVSLRIADAYALPDDLGRFDVAMVHFWWSHVLRQDRGEFLRGLKAHLHPGSLLLMIDQKPTDAPRFVVSRWDAEGNRYEMRLVRGHGSYEIVKNYPDEAELRDSLACVCARVRITCLRHLWALGGRIR